MNYYYLALDGKQAGPFPSDQILQMIRDGRAQDSTLAFTKGMSNWTPLQQVPEFTDVFAATSSEVPSLAAASAGAPPALSDGPIQNVLHTPLKYEIVGHEMQFVEIILPPNQTIIAEAGSMMFMSQGIQFDTQLGDGSDRNSGFLGKVLEAGKRVITGATLFLTTFTARSNHPETVAFSAPTPGKIVPLDLTELGGSITCEKHSFLCASKGTSINVEFTRRMGAGFFGGEGFILQRISGNGMAFIHAGGTIVERTLQPGETLRVDTGCIVAFQPTVTYDIQFVGNIKTAVFGGEGLFFAALTGPGRVWLQSLPFSRLADRILAAAPKAGGSHVDEGGVLGRLGDLIGGDQG